MSVEAVEYVRIHLEMNRSFSLTLKKKKKSIVVREQMVIIRCLFIPLYIALIPCTVLCSAGMWPSLCIDDRGVQVRG